jgi:tetratricopeptide (TPR) repeat protein
MKRKSLNNFGIALFISSVTLISVVWLPGCNDSKSPGQLTVVEDSVTIPTYLVDPPNPMPRFYEGQAHQGVQRRMYPYPMDDNMTHVKEDRTYHIIYVENEYIKIGIMPGLGGRIYEAIDKTNGYKFLYRNDVIKPSLIGMLGFWISGGNAVGFPHHHGANTVAPMDYTIEKKPDGSVTVWMAYTEQFHRTRLFYGFTMYPNSSIVEMTARPANPTPVVNSFLFWANPSVHADTNYQVIFPPSIEYVTQHHKTEMTTWPIADRRYNRFDYDGKDISMWKNTGVPSSFFSWDPQEDFFGGYDRGQQAGTAWIGNHHICTGMKYWADGNNAAGRRINDGLTDSSGRYIELMAGAYTDNQPDYSWLQPYESKDFTMTWFPIRNLGGLNQANRNAALFLNAGDYGNVSIRMNTTSLYKNAKVVLTYDGKELLNESITISPALPFEKDVAIEGPVDKEKLVCALYDSSGELLLEYQPEPPLHRPMPEPLSSPQDPEDVKTMEELYLNGLRLDQFHNASISSYPYYEEALKRDPGDYRVNTQLGILYIKRKMFEEAEKHLQTAVDRITMRYTRPKDSEALYYLGIAQRRLQKNKVAYDNFYDATWNAGWSAQSYHQLAELDCENGKYETALDHINRALGANSNDSRAVSLKVVILRKLGRLKEAESLATQGIEKDLLDYQLRNELYLINKELNKDAQANANLKELDRIMGDRIQSYLEFSSAYSNCGFYAEAIDILSRLESRGNQYPLLYYYLGYFWMNENDTEKAQHYFAEAKLKSHLYCFPFRDESVEALQAALTFDQDDAMANYYLGNMYYESQPEKAVEFWEKSRSINNDFYIVKRNLALAAREQQSDLGKAVQLYAEAFASNHEDQRLMYEYDVALERFSVSPAERHQKVYEGNRSVSEKRTSTFLREIELLVFLGEYDEVVDILNTAEFVESEGSQNLRDIFHNAYILRSLKLYETGNYEEAIGDMQAALDYPIGRWGSERRAQMNYLLGTYYEKAGNIEEAENSYQKAIDEVVEGSEYLYYKGLAYQKTGQYAKSREQFNALLKMNNRSGRGRNAFRSFEGGSGSAAMQAQQSYIKGLAFLGLGRKSEAAGLFKNALALDPSHLWADYMVLR